MFKRRDSKSDISIYFDGRQLPCRSGETVAAAILAAGPEFTRLTPKNGVRRAPYCMMGACFECLMEIDGVANRQACLTTVEDGMRVNRQTLVTNSDWA
jgi:predicted molibdopterin-dependent oxidoreductase YjgC